MYKCMTCGHLFADGEQKKWREDYGEILCGCPICLGAFEKIMPCKICKTYMHDIDEDSCSSCKEKIKIRFSMLVDRNFTKEEREVLNDLYDGRNI